MKVGIKRTDTDKSNTAVSVGTYSKKKYPKISLLVVVLLLIFGIGVGAYVIHKSDGTKSKSCSNDKILITKYNDTVRNQGVTKMQEITAILQKKDVTNDATCTYMLMIAQYGDPNSKDEVNTYDVLKKLESQGNKVSKDINDSINRDVLEKYMLRLKAEKGKSYYGEG